MKKGLLIILSVVAMLSASCSGFLKENPKTFLSPDTYFTSEAQMQAAVDGLYTFLDDIFDSDVEVGTQRFVFLEYMTGYGRRMRAASGIYMDQANLLTVTEENTNVESLWKTAYIAIENCNVAISGIESSTAEVSADTRNWLLGQAYFMRAYHYFNLVRLWGEVPLKNTPTTDLSNTAIPLTSVEGIYGQITSDLETAEQLMENAVWKTTDGKVGKAAVKSLLAKVYMTMAGYPLQLGKEYYTLAYEKAMDVVDNSGFTLCATYDDLRTGKFACGSESILTIEREADKASSPVHTALLPYPELANISQNSAYGGAIAPTVEFYNSYDADDLRKADYGYFTTRYHALDGNGEVEADAPYIYKYWDSDAASNSGKSAMSYPLIRYADVLLLMAEAKVMSDGGTTSDQAALDAYWAVRQRAMPSESEPASLDFNTVFKERLWELCFETQTWFDMLRTRKALDTTTGQIVDLIGYRTPGHDAAFEEKDLLYPYPLREKRLNPNLVRK